MTFCTSTLLAEICLIILVNSQEGNDYLDGNENISEDFQNRLDSFYPGDTLSFTDLSDIITNEKLEDDVYRLQFTSGIHDLFNRRMLIAQSNDMNQIISIRTSFHNENDDIVLDFTGSPIEYTLQRHELGHVLDLSEQDFKFSHFKCWLQLQTNLTFDPQSLLFHLSQSRSSSSAPPSKINHVYNAEFRIRWFNASPDTYSRSILTINDQFPPPTIIVNQGDMINITVINESSEPTAIHWHGLLQRKTLHMDGVPGVTQCAILPNQSFVYTYSTNDQSGTYWYHSHYAMQYGDGLKGVLIIKDPNDPWKTFYEDEEILQLTDWYHIPVHIQLQSYLSPGTPDPIPDTILINGMGSFNCSSNEECLSYRTSIRVGTTKRYRIINTSVYATISLIIDQHEMRLIEVDGIHLNGNKSVRSLRLNPGQRYSVLITAKENSNRSYWIRATIHPFLDFDNQSQSVIHPTVKFVLEYVNENVTIRDIPSDLSDDNNAELLFNQSITMGEEFSDESGLSPIENNVPIHGNVRTFFFNSEFQGSEPGYFYLNNRTFVHPTNQSLLSLLVHGTVHQSSLPGNIHVENNEIIDLIINNVDYASHPFHLHGHHVWILAQGKTHDGYINETTLRNIPYNLVNPIRRDTFTINPYSHIVVRFKADNPGLWMMHCHNDWHLQLGMAIVIVESSKDIQNFYSQKHFLNHVPLHCSNHHS